MSGHSKWSTIKRKKEATDQVRGKVFSKLSKAISIAVKTGGGSNPDSNYKLRMAIDAARAVNMPKANIDRVLQKAETDADLSEIVYEGFGPGNVGVLVEVATDNRNRTGQEVKGIFDRGGGSFAGPGAVSYNFEPKIYILLEKAKNPEEQILALIDLGVDDVEEIADGIEAFVSVDQSSNIRQTLEQNGFMIKAFELTQKPKNIQEISDPKVAARLIALFEALEDNEDVQNVYSNADIQDKLVETLS